MYHQWFISTTWKKLRYQLPYSAKEMKSNSDLPCEEESDKRFSMSQPKNATVSGKSNQFLFFFPSKPYLIFTVDNYAKDGGQEEVCLYVFLP